MTQFEAYERRSPDQRTADLNKLRKFNEYLEKPVPDLTAWNKEKLTLQMFKFLAATAICSRIEQDVLYRTVTDIQKDEKRNISEVIGLFEYNKDKFDQTWSEKFIALFMQLLKIEQEKPSKYLNKQDVSKLLEPVVVFVKHRENTSDFV